MSCTPRRNYRFTHGMLSSRYPTYKRKNSMASTVPTGGDLILDGDDLSFESEEVDGERLSVIVVYPQRASVISVSEILQKLFPDVQRSQLYNRLSRSNIKQKALSARLVSQLRDAGAIPASTHRPSVVSRDDALKIIANLKKSPIVPRPRRPKDETDWSGRAETRDGEAIGDADANHADDVEDDDEEAIGDDDDDDFFLPGTAPPKEKRRGGKSRMMTEKVSGVLTTTTTSSKCGRGRKQCPHCQRKVATCRTKCPDCSYQFVVTPPKVNGGDGGGALSSASPAVTKSPPPPPPPPPPSSSSRQETAKRQGNGKRRRNRKKGMSTRDPFDCLIRRSFA